MQTTIVFGPWWVSPRFEKQFNIIYKIQGLGEFDRLPIQNLTQVENSGNIKSYYYLKPGFVLCKGGKRVTILNPSIPDFVPLDIILHEQEAYIRETPLEFDNREMLQSDIFAVNSSIHHKLSIALA